MAIRPLNSDLNNISALDDEPNDVGGMSAGELKGRFDAAGNTIKDYLNNTLIPDVCTEISDTVSAVTVASGNMPAGGTTGQALVKTSNANFAWGFKTIQAMPPGGAAGTVLTKTSAADYDAQFVSLPKPVLPKKLIATFTTSGTFSLASYGLAIGDKIDVYMTGGGGGGAGNGSSSGSGGGGGGYCKLIRDFTLAANSYSIVIGAGGVGVAGAAGTNGGSTTAFGTTAGGGSGASTSIGGTGGSGGGSGNSSAGVAGAAFGAAGNSYSGGGGGGNVEYTPVNPYDNIPYGCGGGGGIGGTGGGAGGNPYPNYTATPAGLGGGGGGGMSTTPGGNGGVGGGGGGGGSTTAGANIGGNGGGGIVYIYA